MPDKSNSERILYILKILYEQTDRDHPISTIDLLKTLEEKCGITTFRTTVPRDIASLVEFGFDVKTITVTGVSSSYYLSARQFSIPELKMLIDAVSAARFISEEKSAKLIQKLKKLTSINQARALSGSMVVAGNIKPENQQIYEWIDDLQNAINKGTQVSFQYYEYNQKKKLVLKERAFY